MKQIPLGDVVQESRAAIEAISPSHPADALPREVEFDWITPQGQAVQKRYIQGQLGLFAVEEFTTRITGIVDSFMKGEFGMKISELFSGKVEMPVTLNPQETQGFLDENEQLINAFLHLIKIVPDLRLDITVWALGVPRLEQPWAKDCMREAPYRGGLSVEEGMDILILFVKQNVPLLRTTLLGKAQELVEVFRSLVVDEEEKTQTSSSSTDPSSVTTAVEEPTTTEPATPGGTPSSISSPPIAVSG